MKKNIILSLIISYSVISFATGSGYHSKLSKLSTIADNNAICNFIASTTVSTTHTDWQCISGIAVSDPCSWQQIECDTVTRNIIAINIDNPSPLIQGSLPISISNLIHLTLLSVTKNLFTGSVPTSIGSLTNLQTLDLSGNRFTSSLPSSIGELKYLNSLKLTNNKLIGQLPSTIGCLSSLAEMSISNNKFSGSLPSSLGQLSSLTYFEASQNNLQFTIPSTLGNLLKLTYFCLSGTALTGPLPSSIGLLSNLQTIDLSGNGLTSSLPSSIGALKSLSSLTLSSNKFIGVIPSSIGNLSSLKRIFLNVNKFSKTIPSLLGQLSGLTWIALYKNNFQSSIPSTIGRLTNCVSLRIFSNSLTSTIPSVIGLLTALTRLELYSNKLSGNLPSSIGYLTNMKILTLNGNKLNGHGPNFLCQNLLLIDTLYLYDNKFTCLISCQSDNVWLTTNTDIARCSDKQDIALYDLDNSLKISTYLQSLTTTSTYEYQGNSSSGSFPICISYVNVYRMSIKFDIVLTDVSTSLYYEICDLSGNEICNNVYGYYGIFNNFSILEVHGNDVCINQLTFAGSPSTWMYFFTITTYSYLRTSWVFHYNSTLSSYVAGRLCSNDWHGISCTNGDVTAINLLGFGLSGTIPSTIGYLSALTSLNLQANIISGTIPSSIGYLSHLITITLSHNELMGTIPTIINQVLPKLVTLNLQNNKLSGSLPRGFSKLNNLFTVNLGDNKFVGEISSEFCEIIIDKPEAKFIFYDNPQLTCYHKDCWSLLNISSRYFTVSECNPTTSPTVHPTFSPTSKLSSTSTTSNLSTAFLIGIILGCIMLTIILIILMIYFNCCSKSAIKERHINETLQTLPVHYALLKNNKISEIELLQLIQNHLDTVNKEDFKGHTALDIILEKRNIIKVSVEIIIILLTEAIQPIVIEKEQNIIYENIEIISTTLIDNVWCRIIQKDEEIFISAIQYVLKINRKNASKLAYFRDSNGRKSIDIACPRSREVLLRMLYLNERYELNSSPIYSSSTTIIIHAIDYGINSNIMELNKQSNGQQSITKGSNKEIILKFIKYKIVLQKELNFRIQIGIENDFIIPLIESYNSDETDERNIMFRTDAILKGFEAYPYCIVLEVASLSLKSIIDKTPNMDMDEIKHLMKQLLNCLELMSSKNLVHGDMKPANIVLSQNTLKLIDFDISNVLPNETLPIPEWNLSTAYLPPECFTETEIGDIVVHEKDNFPLTSKSDIWSVGCILYTLCTGSTLFQCSSTRDEVSDEENLLALYLWDNEIKARKLSKVKDIYAMNLISLMLNKDPKKRPDPSHILCHPFLSGKKSTRLPGQEPFYDIFLSYRVDSDSNHVEMIYNELTKLGLKVWWDKLCLQPGQPWEEGFCSGLISSSCFVCLLSRGAIKHPNKTWQNFENLTENSRCDNVFLEHRLALELYERDMIRGVFPVMIGDIQTDGSYSNYFTSGCNPLAPDITVNSVEIKLREHLDREGQGLPFKEFMTVKMVLNEILANQGGFMEGNLSISLNKIVTSIMTMYHNTKSPCIVEGIGKSGNILLSVKETKDHHIWKLKSVIDNLKTDLEKNKITVDYEKEIIRLRDELKAKDVLIDTMQMKSQESLIKSTASQSLHIMEIKNICQDSTRKGSKVEETLPPLSDLEIDNKTNNTQVSASLENTIITTNTRRPSQDINKCLGFNKVAPEPFS